MADTTFVNFQTPILAEWLNDVNDLTYNISGTGSGQGASQVGMNGGGTVQTALDGYAPVSAFVFGVGATGAGDAAADTAAINAAVATGKIAVLPFGDFKYNGNLLINEGGIVGSGHGIGGVGAKFTTLTFYNCTDPLRGAIYNTQAMRKGFFIRLANLYVIASSWDGSTGCLGYGLELESPIIGSNCVFYGFKKSGIWAHHSSTSQGPYQSMLVNFKAVYCGQHGILIGSGANTMTLQNCEGKWNGAPSYGVAPSVAGSYDGLYVDDTSDGAAYPAYIPANLKVLGGDFSYNSRYGQNIHNARGIEITPGYAESNLSADGFQHRVGTLRNASIDLGYVVPSGGPQCKVDATTGSLADANTIASNGYQLGGASNAGQTQLTDKSLSTLGGIRERRSILGADDVGGTNSTQMWSRVTGETLFVPSGTGYFEFSSGARFGNSAVANANTLDWYEEGTFTPTLIGTSTAGAGTYSVQVGTFTRVGNVVTFAISFTWSAHTGTGSLKVSGLPYVAKGVTNGVWPVAVAYDALVIGVGKQMGGAIIAGTSSVSLYAMDTAGGALGLVALDTAGTLYISGAYHV